MVFSIPVIAVIGIDSALAKIEGAIHGFSDVTSRQYIALPVNVPGAHAVNVVCEDGQVVRVLEQFNTTTDKTMFRIEVAVR